MSKANEESNEKSAALMRDLAKRRIALIRKHLKETGENKPALSAELERISKNLKNKKLEVNELENNIRALIYIKKNVDSSLDKNGKSSLISPLEGIEKEILEKDSEAGVKSQAERMFNQLSGDDKKSEDPQAREFDKLNEELKEKINNFLGDFYEDKKFFSEFKKYFLMPIFNIKFDKDKYGFSYKELKDNFKRMVAFVEKIEDINKIENISEIQRARLVFRLLEEHPTFLDDAKKFHEHAIKLADLDKKKADRFQKGDENGLRLTDYTIKFLQWIPKYELQLDRFKGLSSYPNEVKQAEDLKNKFNKLLATSYMTPSEVSISRPVPPPRKDIYNGPKYQEIIDAGVDLQVKLYQEKSPDKLLSNLKDAKKYLEIFDKWKESQEAKKMPPEKINALESFLKKNENGIKEKIEKLMGQANLAFSALNTMANQKKFDIGVNGKEVREKIDELRAGIEIILLLESKEPSGNYKKALDILERLETHLKKAENSVLMFKRVAQNKALKEVKKMVTEQKDVFQKATMKETAEISSPTQSTKTNK